MGWGLGIKTLGYNTLTDGPEGNEGAEHEDVEHDSDSGIRSLGGAPAADGSLVQTVRALVARVEQLERQVATLSRQTDAKGPNG
jgi:hypothetical protein